MEKVYVVYSVDANDETLIYGVFSSYDSAFSYKVVKSSSMLGSFERFYIEEFELWK